MDVPFRSPRPPAPRRARGNSMSRQASGRSQASDDFMAGLNEPGHTAEPPVPPLPAGMVSLAPAAAIVNMPAVADGNHEQNVSTSNNGASSTSILARLEALLVAKSNEIQLAGRLGEALLSQQAELEARIREVEDQVTSTSRARSGRRGRGTAYNDAENGHGQDVDSEEHGDVFRTASRANNNDSDSDAESLPLDDSVRERLQALEQDMLRWERGNEEIYRGVGVPSGTSSELVRQASSASMRTPAAVSQAELQPAQSEQTQDDPALAAGGLADASMSPSASRRQRNAQHRSKDIEFATEIGQSLLVEVRRLQALLTEQETKLAASKAEKDGLERTMESFASSLKTTEDSLDKFREENWNLEVQNQEVRTQNTDLSSNISKLDSERARLTKELTVTRDALDGQKVDNERIVAQLEALQSKHETDMANMRRTTAGLQREKSDLQTALDAAKNELTLRARGIRRSVSAASNNTLGTNDSAHTPNGFANAVTEEDEDEEDDLFGTNRRGTLTGRRRTNENMLDSPFASDADNSLGIDSPSVRNISESEKLRGNLAHAQKTIQTLKAALIREKEAKLNLKRKLGGSSGQGQDSDGVEGESDEDNEDLLDDEAFTDDGEVDENNPGKRRRTIIAGSARRGRGARGGRGGIVASRRGRGGVLLGRLPRGLEPSRLSSEVPSGDEASANGSIIERELAPELSMSSEQEELASLPDEQDRLDGIDARSIYRASHGSMASIDPAFGNILPASRSMAPDMDGSLPPLARGSTRDNRPSSMMFAGDFNLMEQIKSKDEEIERLKAAIPAPAEPIDTKEIGIMTEALPMPVKADIREFSTQTAAEVPVEVKSFAVQTEVAKIETGDRASQTETAMFDDKATMTIPSIVPVVPTKEMHTMTAPIAAGHMSTQTEIPSPAHSPVIVPAMLPPANHHAKVMIDRGSDPHTEWPVAAGGALEDGNASANMTAMSFTGTLPDVATPTLESTPVLHAKSLPDEAELVAPNVPDRTHRPNFSRDDSSIAQSFKSFSHRDTDYDTATETEGDFEDARETLATFDGASMGLMRMANASQSTIMHSALGAQDSDQESEHSVRPTPRYRRTDRSRSREPSAVMPAVEVPKPVMVDAGMQTDAIPQTMVTSPTILELSDAAEMPIPSPQSTPWGKRFSAATFGNSTMDSTDTVLPASAAAGLVYFETVSPTAQAPPNSAASSLSRQPSLATRSGESEYTEGEASVPVSPSGKARPPKLSIPPPPSEPPTRETLKHAASPTFRPPRPSSPPPPDLLQRAQTPTFLAPGSVGKKRASTIGDSHIGTPVAYSGNVGSMPLHRNEAHFGASPAPLPHHRQSSQPRSAASIAQLRSAPSMRYQAAGEAPDEYGNRQGATTPINQMMAPPSRYGSTRRRREHGASSRASMSSMGSTHSRNPSVASSTRTSEIGTDGLPSQTGAAGDVVSGSTDPATIHAITQTMIGEFLFKYTRTTFTKDHSDKRHQRFFWIHPYTKTLYWSNSDPGAAGVNQSKAKSVFIAGVRVEKDANPYPPGLYQTSIVVSTIGREIKLTAPTKERHEMWMTAINYLLAREDGPNPSAAAAGGPGTPSSGKFSSFGRSVNRSAASLRFRQKSDPMSLAEVGVLTASTGSKGNTMTNSTVVPRNRAGKNTLSKLYNHETVSEPRLTPKPSASTKKARKMSTATSLYKRPDTPAAEYEQYIAEYGSPRSVRSYKTTGRMTPAPSSGPNAGFGDSLEIIDRRDVLGAEEQDGYEGLENVRACCNGEHDVGKLSVSRKHGHHHHHKHSHAPGQGYDSSTMRSTTSAARSNSVASKTSRKTGMSYGSTNSHVHYDENQPPVPQLGGDPGSPSLRARSLSSTLRGISSYGTPRRSTHGDMMSPSGGVNARPTSSYQMEITQSSSTAGRSAR